MYNEYFSPQLKYVSHPINQSTVSRRYSGILSSLPNFWSPCAENVQLISVSASPSHGDGVHIVFISTLCQQMLPIIIHTTHCIINNRGWHQLSRLFHRISCLDFLD